MVPKSYQKFGIFVILSSVVLWVAAFLLSRDSYLLAAEGVTPSCDVNPFFSCGSVFGTWQAKVFLSAPNQLFGVAGYMIVGTVGVAMIQGAMFKQWFWRAFLTGMFLAWGFLMWLFTQSVFMIGFLCLYCMIVWAAHTVLLFPLTLWLMREGLLTGNIKVKEIGSLLLPYSWLPVVLTFSVIFVSILVQFPLLFAF
jgi:uncharacterized membrane protein